MFSQGRWKNPHCSKIFSILNKCHGEMKVKISMRAISNVRGKMHHYSSVQCGSYKGGI